MELADQLSPEAEGAVAGAEIPLAEPASPDVSTPEKPLSLREQILKNVETVRTEEAKRARAADGKFTKLEAAPEQAAPEIPPTEQNAQPEASQPVGPPSGWSKEAQALWETLPPAVKADAVRREAEVAKGFDEYRSKTAQLSEISQALEPLKPILQQSGIQTEAQAVKRLLEWEGSFRNPHTRMQAFQNLAQTYGVDLSTLVQNPSPAPSSAQEIPEPLRPVLDQFGNIQQQVQSVDARLQSWEQAQTAKEVSAFASDPKHPHFEAVRVEMGRLMETGFVRPGDLETAYQKAVAMNPEISAQIRAAEDKARADELAKANAEKAAKARQAAISPGQRSPSVAPSNSAKGKTSSVRDTLLNSIGELREGQRA